MNGRIELQPYDASVHEFDLTKGTLGWFGYEPIWVHDGDLEYEPYISGFPEKALDSPRSLLIVDGDFTVYGSWSRNINLYVTGNFSADVLDGCFDQTIMIDGDAEIAGAILALAQDSGIEICGTTHVPYLFWNQDHALQIDVAPGCREVIFYRRDPSMLYPLLEELKLEYEPAEEEPHWLVIKSLL